MLHALRLPPQVTSVSDSPAAALTQSGYNLSTTPTHLSATQWWTSRQSADQVEAYLRAHPPIGFALTGTGTVRTVADLMFQPAGSRDGHSVLVWQVLPTTQGAALRVDAVVVWVPAAPLAHVPGDATEAVASVGSSSPLPGQPGTAAKTGILKGTALRKLAAAFNTYTPYVESGSAGCQGAGPAARVAFHAPGHVLVFSWLAHDCDRIHATYDGRPAGTLEGAPLPLVEQLLHVKLIPFK